LISEKDRICFSVVECDACFPPSFPCLSHVAPCFPPRAFKKTSTKTLTKRQLEVLDLGVYGDDLL
jgi:hypothetical protein